eukprot:278560-Chlamydomonas_euryale.AAC.1
MRQYRVRVLVRGSGGAPHAGQDAADALADELDWQDSALPTMTRGACRWRKRRRRPAVSSVGPRTRCRRR